MSPKACGVRMAVENSTLPRKAIAILGLAIAGGCLHASQELHAGLTADGLAEISLVDERDPASQGVGVRLNWGVASSSSSWSGSQPQMMMATAGSGVRGLFALFDGSQPKSGRRYRHVVGLGTGLSNNGSAGTIGRLPGSGDPSGVANLSAASSIGSSFDYPLRPSSITSGSSGFNVVTRLPHTSQLTNSFIGFTTMFDPIREFGFPNGGVTQFTLSGISPLDMKPGGEFATSFTYDGTGNARFSETPIAAQTSSYIQWTSCAQVPCYRPPPCYFVPPPCGCHPCFPPPQECVPEPGSLTLWGLGALLLGCRRWTARNKAG